MTEPTDEFYVGYLPVPAKHKRFLFTVVPALLLLISLVAGVLAAAQRDPGQGRWHDDQTLTLTGLLLRDPCAMLVTQHEGRSRTVLLVGEGKKAATLTQAPAHARVTGTLLVRGAQHLLEVTSSPEVIGSAATPQGKPLGRATLTGEIIDPKCYSGAMKPGEGKTHKACASLCIRGGIPPMFLSTREPLRPYLLVTPGRDSRTILPYVADLIDVTGELVEHRDLTWFIIDPHTIHRH